MGKDYLKGFGVTGLLIILKVIRKRERLKSVSCVGGAGLSFE